MTLQADLIGESGLTWGQVSGNPLAVRKVTVRPVEGNARLMAIILKDGPLTAEDRDYLDACERGDG